MEIAQPGAPDPGSEGKDGSLSREDLRDAAVSGVRWTVVVRVGAEVLGFGASIVLAHLIAPAEFGRAAVAIVLPTLAVVLTFWGYGSVLVQRDRLDTGEAQTAMLLAILSGFVLTVAVFASTPVWAEPLFGSETAELLRLASLAFAFAGIGVVSRAMLQRRLDFRRQGIIEVAAYAVGTTSSIVMALAGLDAEALVLGMLTIVATEALLLILVARPPLPRLVPGHARQILSFGSTASVAGLATVARRNVDYVILGATLPAAQVGLYWRAFLLGAEYQSKVTGIIVRLAFPLFSRTRDLEDMKHLRRRIVRTNTLVIFPLLATLVVIAPTLVPWIYGTEWTGAVVPAQVLAIGGMALTVRAGTEAMVLALGRPDALLGFNLAFLAATAAAVLLAGPHGLVAVSIAVSGVFVVMVTLSQVWLLGAVAGIRARELLEDIGPAVVASSVAVGIGLTVGFAAETLDQPLLVVLILSTATLGAYVVALRMIFQPAWSELVRMTRRVTGRTRAPASAPATVQ